MDYKNAPVFNFTVGQNSQDKNFRGYSKSMKILIRLYGKCFSLNIY